MGYLIENLRDNLGVKKMRIIFGFLILLIVLIIVLVFNFAYDHSPKGYVIVGESVILTKSNGKWVQIKEMNDKILSSKYTVIYDSNKLDDVTINYTEGSNSWIYMDNNYTDIGIKHADIAYTGLFENIKAADYQISYYSPLDNSAIDSVLVGKDFEAYEKSIRKYSYDLDGDGIVEDIFTLSNMSLAGYNGKNYSFIFLARDGKFVRTFNDDTNDYYKVVGIADIDGDNKYEVIVNKGDLDMSYFDSCYQIYKVVGDKITMLKDCN